MCPFLMQLEGLIPAQSQPYSRPSFQNYMFSNSCASVGAQHVTSCGHDSVVLKIHC